MIATPQKRTKLTPPELARRWGISADKILRWIASGEIRATNAASSSQGRPRWLIDLADLAEFESRRAAQPKTAAPRRRKVIKDVIEFF
jgi:excisionase family DNA binding protein